MGLRLRKHSSSFPCQLPAPTPPGRASDSETEIYSTSEPFSYGHLHRSPVRIARPPNRAGQEDNGRLRKRRRLTRSQRERTPGETRHVRSRQLWTRDAAEGYALARSSLQLPSDNNTNTFSLNFTEPQWSRSSSRRRSSTSLSPRRGRPPSLERQDAFRDERTAKSRHSHHESDHELISSSYLLRQSETAEHPSREGDKEVKEIADLYRMGLLYDNEYERGAGFSLDRIVRDCAEEPAYSVRVRPTKRAGREGSCFVSLSYVDLAFEALVEDEALAGWLMSDSQREKAAAADALRAAAASFVHESPRLAAIYELAGDAASATSAEDFLDSAYVSELSYCVAKDNASEWAIIDGCNGTNEKATAVAARGVVEAAVAEDGGVDSWVVLGHDGS